MNIYIYIYIYIHIVPGHKNKDMHVNMLHEYNHQQKNDVQQEPIRVESYQHTNEEKINQANQSIQDFVKQWFSGVRVVINCFITKI